MSTAIFAAGCFWGVQYYFDQVPGVNATTVGFIGGHSVNPRYDEVCTGTTGHAEAIQIDFDPEVVSYQVLLQHFFRLHDPTQHNRQGPDIGEQYRSAIFYMNEDQKRASEEVVRSLQPEHNNQIVTELTPATEFYPAEAYHQKFTERTGRGECRVSYAPLT